MKNKKTVVKIVSAVLAFTMMFLMLPFTAIQSFAVEISEYDDIDHLGKGYNLLGDDALTGTALNQQNRIFNSNIMNIDEVVFEYSNTGITSSFSYSYIKDMSSYLRSQSNSLNIDISASAKIKIVSIEAETKMGLQTSSSSSGSTKTEYAVLKANQKHSTYVMHIDGLKRLRAIWDNNAVDSVFKEEAKMINGEISVEDFVKSYGTHIVTGYSKGGEASVTYSSSDMSFAFSNTSQEDFSISGGAGVSVVGGVNSTVQTKMEEQNKNESSISNIEIASKAVGGNNVLDLSKGLNEDNINTYFDSINDKNAEILVDNSLRLIPIWELLVVSGDEYLVKAGIAIKEYFQSEIEAQCEAFYSEYLNDEYYIDSIDEWIGNPEAQIITNATEFNNIRNDLYGTYVLANNIDLSCFENWEPIGTEEAPFMGEIFGNENTVSNMKATANGEDHYLGLFGYNSGTINNLRVTGSITATASPDIFIGGIAAYNRGIVKNCYDNVDYNVTYSSVNDLNLPLREIDLESLGSQTITIGDEIGIKLKGKEGATYTGVNIVIEDKNVDSPAYIVLDNANIIGDSTDGTIFGSTRDLHLISIGTANSVMSCVNAAAVNIQNRKMLLFGNADVSIIGGNGGDGNNGVSGQPDAEDGENGSSGLIAKSIYIDITSELNIVGGNGGNGGIGYEGETGSIGSKSSAVFGEGGTGGPGHTGGKGGDGGHGASGVDTNSEYNFAITLISGVCNIQDGIGGNGGQGGQGGRGGQGGTATGNWSTAGKGGIGGTGGTGGNSGSYYVSDYVCIADEINYISGMNGSVGGAGSGGSGGSHGDMQDLCCWNAGDGSPGAQGSAGAITVLAPSDRIASPDADFVEVLILKGICFGKSKDSIKHINQSDWLDNSLEIDAVYKTLYYSGDNFEKSDLRVLAYDKFVSDYTASINTYCSEFVSERTGYIKIARDGKERYVPIHIIKTVPEAIFVEKVDTVEYIANSQFSISGLSLRLEYNSGKLEYINETDPKLTHSMPDMQRTEKQTVTLYYDHDSDSATPALTCSYEINISMNILTDIFVTNAPKLNYKQGDSFDPDGMVVIAYRKDGSSEQVDLDELNFEVDPSMCTVGTNVVTVKYGGIETSFEINVSAKPGYDHAWDQGVVSKAPTHTKSGVLSYSCTVDNCNATKTEAIAPIEGHSYGSWYNLDENRHQQRCECGDTITVAHKWDDGTITKNPTHLEQGTELYVCSDCKVEKTVILPTTAEHGFGDWQKKDDEYHTRECECGETEEALHSWNAGDVVIEPTYTTAGLMTYSCGVCGETKTVELPMVDTDDAPTVLVDSKLGTIGKNITVDIALINNPGIASMKLLLTYDTSVLELTDIKFNNAMGGQYQMPQTYGSPVVLNWFNATDNTNGDIVFATLVFDVVADAPVRVPTQISVTYDPEDIYDITETNIDFFVTGGEIIPIDYTPGDMNGDESVNNKDLTRLFQYLAGWNVTINEKAYDVNGDGVVNNKDLTRLAQYLTGWDVEIY